MKSGAATSDRPLQPSDVFSWYLERDPALRVPVVLIAELDREPDELALRARTEAALRTVPQLSEVVVEAPWRLAPPRWTRVAEVDLDWHLRRVAVASPATEDALLELARLEATTPFDTKRPMWTLTVVHGLPEGRAALLLRFHHSLTDGVGGVALAAEIFDLERQPSRDDTPLEPLPAAREHPLLDALVEQTRTVALGAPGTTARMLHETFRSVAHPRNSARTVASIARTVAPVRRPVSPLLVDRGIGRSLHVVDLALPEFHAAARAQGVTVNDALLAGVARGVRRYHERHGQQLQMIRVTMPVDLRRPSDPPGGNRITLMRFLIPTGGADVGRHLRGVRVVAQRQRLERSLPHTQGIARALAFLPPAVVGSMLKHVEALVSDVPGPPVPPCTRPAPASPVGTSSAPRPALR